MTKDERRTTDDRQRPPDDIGERIERALEQLKRVEPAPDLSARIIASLPPRARGTSVNAWLSIATLLAALVGFVLAYQTAFSLRANGAFELVAYYTAQPEIVTMYPDQAWSALAAAIPWMTAAVSVLMFAVTLGLTIRWTSRAARILS
jgi:hypothetical protein